MADPLIRRSLHAIGHLDSALLVFGTPAWILGGIVFVVIVFLVFWPFLRHLPPATRALFLIAGGLYVAGTIGFEELGAIYVTYRQSQLIYSMLVAVEEGLEMVGVVIFLYALMAYMATQGIEFQLVFDTRPPST
jgi:hypothetical protein